MMIQIRQKKSITPSLTAGLHAPAAHCPLHTFLTRIPGARINLAPAAADLFENQIAVGVKTSLHSEDFTDAVAVEIELVNKIK